MNNHKFPQNYWDDTDRTDLNVLVELVSETKRPLFKILSYSKLLLDVNDLPDEHRHQIETIYKAAEYLETILNAGAYVPFKKKK